MTKANLPKKEFFSDLERALDAASVEKLRDILRGMAFELAPGERADFLSQVRKASATSEKVAETLSEEDLVASIDDFIDGLEEMMEDAEDPSYEGYDDEDSLGPYADLVDDLGLLVDETIAAFDSGDTNTALAGFNRLFDVFELEDDYGRGIR